MAERDGKGGGNEAHKASAAAAAGTGKGKLLVSIGVALTLLLGGGGAAAYFMLGKKNPAVAQVDEDRETGEEAVDAGKKTRPEKPRKARRKARVHAPVFVELDMFTANLKDEDADRFIQVKLVAEVRDGPAGETLKAMMPAVRNEVLLLLGSKEAKDIATREGKEQLAGEIVAAANHTLEGTPAANGVEGVNFTHIIVQ